MGHGLRAGLLGVVDEVALGVQLRIGGQDLDGVLVGADRAVRTEAEEDRPQGLRRLDVERRVVGQAGAGDVVGDADGEPGAGPFPRQLGEHPGDHARGELLRPQAVPAADNGRQHVPVAGRMRLGQRRQHVQEQRLAQRTGFFGAVQHGDPTRGGRQRRQQRPGRERPVQPHLQHTDPLTGRR